MKTYNFFRGSTKCSLCHLSISTNDVYAPPSTTNIIKDTLWDICSSGYLKNMAIKIVTCVCDRHLRLVLPPKGMPSGARTDNRRWCIVTFSVVLLVFGVWIWICGAMYRGSLWPLSVSWSEIIFCFLALFSYLAFPFLIAEMKDIGLLLYWCFWLIFKNKKLFKILEINLWDAK